MKGGKIAQPLKLIGPWYCRRCVREFEEAGLRDITLDLELMRYLATDELPDDDKTLTRVLQMDGKMWIEDEHLWYKLEEEGPPLIVPPIHNRCAIVKAVHATMAAPSGECLYTLLCS